VKKYDDVNQAHTKVIKRTIKHAAFATSL